MRQFFSINDAANGVGLERFMGPSPQWNDYMYADGRIVAARFALDSGTTYLRYFIADLADRARASPFLISLKVWAR